MRFSIPLLVLASIIAPSTSSWAETHSVTQKEKKFSQEMITVKIGDTILFKNDEKDITHNVYSITPENEFELKSQKPRTSTPVVIEPGKHHPGEMLVECAIHPRMKLKVKIVK